MSYRYYKGLTLGPPMTLEWLTNAHAVRDFSTGWTYTAKIAATSAPLVVLRTKTAGITGAVDLPNVTIDWETADHSPLPPDADYVVLLVATPTVGDPIAFDRRPLPTFRLDTAPT